LGKKSGKGAICAKATHTIPRLANLDKTLTNPAEIEGETPRENPKERCYPKRKREPVRRRRVEEKQMGKKTQAEKKTG